MSKEDLGFLFICMFFGIAGCLIGFGSTGTLQGLCTGAGVGMVVPVVLFMLGGPIPPDFKGK